VTGSSGFIGRHMVTELEYLGWEVTPTDLRGDINGGQLNTRDDVRRAHGWPAIKFDLVVHAAAFVGGRVGIEGNPAFLGAYNLQCDAAMFEWALRARPAHFVYLSSSAVYPVALQCRGKVVDLAETDVDLDAPELPDAMYGWSKLTGEQLAARVNAEGLRVHVVRPFSGYGTDQSTDYPFGAFLARVLTKNDPVDVWGGDQIRDWVHVDDVIRTALAVVDADMIDPVNICTGRGLTMTRTVELMTDAVRRLTNADRYRPQIRSVSGKPLGVHRRVGDSTLQDSIRPPSISVEDGIEMALRANL
jgi:nucleoside-diphosphate-sugar epimerase